MLQDREQQVGSGAAVRTGDQSGLPVIILAAALLVMTAALCVNPAPNSDLFWQLRTGDWIVAHHAAPHRDMFSWTETGRPWVAHEWLSFAILALAYRAGGFAGTWIFLALMMAIVWQFHFALALKRMRNDRLAGAPLTAFIVTAGSAIVASPFFQPRPQLFTYLFLLITTWLVTEARESKGRSRRVWLLVPLFAVWANLHSGVILGAGVVFLYALGDVARVLWMKSVRRRPAEDADASLRTSAQLAFVGAAGLAAILLTPYSYHEYENFVATILNDKAMNIVTEWKSVDFRGSFGHQLEIFLAVAAYALIFTRRKLDPVEIIFLVVLVHEAITANRNVPILALIGSLLLAEHLQSALERHLGSSESAAPFGPSPTAVMAVLAGAAFCFYCLSQAWVNLRDLAPKTGPMLERIGEATVALGYYPRHACDFIEREKIPASMHLYNIYGEGGYIIWRLPDHPVFIDGRADVYFGPVLDDADRLRRCSYRWEDILDSHHVDWIITGAADHESRDYLGSPEWALVYADRPDLSKEYMDFERMENSLIFVRRDPRFQSLIAKCRRDCPAFAGSGLARYAEYAAVQ